MKFSITSALAVFSLFSVSALAAPVASPDAVALPNADPLAFAAPAPVADSTLDAVNAGVANITGELGELTKVLTSSKAPKDSYTKITNIVVKLVEGIVDTLGKATGLTEATDSINKLLNTAIGALDTLEKETGLTDTLNKEVDSLVSTVQGLLKNLVSTLNGILKNLFALNLVGVVVALLGGLLKTLGGLLSGL
ncbi:putative secreted protein [Wickerhamomyces ciferrii]|uniref:Secreted protein n=1 Tax=Wickerhamomyces ciferrii (strain ATCC 14091 / BCRC 22168 / CBS 111 / JCM 3599 / NBRC 0793 / NRRL Y-1031 F-60-10) TaxID=1206466 RepID=K0KN29_WICCF|nr:uncharacterized protein BN7_6267 [Wickerhamomyces ciferrii]CCH46670.1 putative secreted protein [Wickerhamomyces ciferrii]